jgi:hypothetical protein
VEGVLRVWRFYGSKGKEPAEILEPYGEKGWLEDRWFWILNHQTGNCAGSVKDP